MSLKTKTLFIATMLLALQSWGVEIPHPVFTAQRVFQLTEKAEARAVTGVAARVFVYESAVAKCGLDMASLQMQFSEMLSGENPVVIRALQSLYPNFSVKNLKDVVIVIDSYGTKSEAFAGFYLPPQKGNPAMISLDCSPASRFSWPSYLSHELVHHMNKDHNVAPWIDEMLAQGTEVRASQLYPQLRFETLLNLNHIPSFFETGKVIENSEQYAVNMLFGLYISQNFGGNQMLQTLTSDVGSIGALAAKVKSFTSSQHEYDWIREYLDPSGLIRNFALAMNINQPLLNGGNLYQVPGWSGFASGNLISKSGKYIVEPGAFLRLSSQWASRLQKISNASHELNIYRILKSPGQFKIQTLNESVTDSWDENFLVVINTSTENYFEVDLN